MRNVYNRCVTPAFIVSAVRTPIGRLMGGLSDLSAPKLGERVVAEAIRRAGVAPGDVDEVIMGTALQAGLGQNPARQAALGAGLPESIAAFTVNKVCGSGMKAILLGDQAIRAGDADVVIAGGMESMTNAPHLLPDVRRGKRLGDAKLVDAMVRDGLWDVTNDFHMGASCELVAERFKVTRPDMDAYAAESHRRALEARAAFKPEILPVDKVEADEGPREDSTIEKLAGLKPVFKKDGLVTAGNASQISDGAAAVVLMSEKALRERKATPLARITGSAVAGVDPKWVLVSTIDTVRRFDKRNPWKASTADLIEINEAFAASTVAGIRELKLDPAKVNVNGGAIALGHPLATSGTRIVVTLLHALAARNAKRGMATLCMGGGNGLAIGVERP